jgi:calpain-15
MFVDGIDPNDIKQGSLGDCYFLAVLSSMAEDPKDIEALFYTKKINAAGCYLVYLYINGVQRAVIVDDYLPCIGN